jgi:hypothetical protein
MRTINKIGENPEFKILNKKKGRKSGILNKKFVILREWC